MSLSYVSTEIFYTQKKVGTFHTLKEGWKTLHTLQEVDTFLIRVGKVASKLFILFTQNRGVEIVKFYTCFETSKWP